MQMSNIDIWLITRELIELKESRLQKIYQIAPDLFRFDFYSTKSGSQSLLIELGKNVRLSTYKFQTPEKPSQYCMYLRKVIKNATLENIEQINFDRILKLTFRGKSLVHLVIELFGKGNVVTIDEDETILLPLKTERWRDRILKKGERYAPPPQRGLNPHTVSFEDFREGFTKKDVVRSLIGDFNLGSILSEEICIRSKIDKNRAIEDLSDGDFNLLYQNMDDTLSNLGSRFIIYYENDEPTVYSPIALTNYANNEKKEFQTFSELVDEYYSKQRKDVLEEKSGEKFEKERARIEKIIIQQKEGIEALEKKIQNLELLTDHTNVSNKELEDYINLFLEYRSKKEDRSSLLTQKYEFESFDEKKKILFIKVKELNLSLPISVNKSIFKNTDALYSQIKKSKSKITTMQEMIIKTERKLEKYEKKKPEIVEKVIVEKKTKKSKKWYENFRWMFSSDDFLIVAGRDATTNEILVKKHMDNDDIFLHSDFHGAPCVLIKSEGKKIEDNTLSDAATFAVSYSNAWKLGLSSMQVYWVLPEQVTKSAPSGEFLKKGGFAIKGRRNYLNSELRIVIGIILDDENVNFVVGTSNSVVKKTKYYIPLIPGNKKSGQIAKEIKQRFSEMVPKQYKEKLKRIGIESIQQLQPPGKSDIVRK